MWVRHVAPASAAAAAASRAGDGTRTLHHAFSRPFEGCLITRFQGTSHTPASSRPHLQGRLLPRPPSLSTQLLNRQSKMPSAAAAALQSEEGQQLHC